MILIMLLQPLGEIRAYGSLIASGIKVNPISTKNVPTPEFQCEINGVRFIIEVLTKQMKEEETKELRIFMNSSSQAGTPSFRYHEVVPFGGTKGRRIRHFKFN